MELYCVIAVMVGKQRLAAFDCCIGPTGFKVKRFPQIIFRAYHNVYLFNGLYSATDQPWVLANGDPTGYSYHVDFRPSRNINEFFNSGERVGPR